MMKPALDRDWIFSPDPDVEAAVRDVYRRYPPHYLSQLDHVHALLKDLGDPHLRLPYAFHAAGTNGKGSTLAFVQAILEAGGRTVHKYISPHLVRFEERVVLNGDTISGDRLIKNIQRIDVAARGRPISFFEFFTALAFDVFASKAADAVLIETGLGGRLDATNVISRNLTSVITRISFDHTHVLGNTLSAIAAEKSGIIKPNCPVVIAEQVDQEVDAVFAERALAASAPVYPYGSSWSVTENGNSFVYQSVRHKFELPLPALVGAHQIMNAGTAIAAVEQSPFHHLLTQEVLEKSMHTVVWPGRLQKLARGPLVDLLPPGWELWIDGAHNDSGAEALARYLSGHGLPAHVICMMKDKKDALTFFKNMQPVLHSATAVDVDVHVKMLASEELCDYMTRAGIPAVFRYANVDAAVRSLVSTFKTPQRMIIAGSLYLAGYVLRDNS